MKLGIVTVLYHSDEVLPGFFRSLTGEPVGFARKLYVIDNSPSSSGTEMAQALSLKYGIDAEFVFNNANLGVAKGNNQGIDLALQDGCSHVLLANNDTEFSDDTIRRLIETLAGGAERVATPKIMYYDDPTLLWYGGGHINAWTMRTPHYGIKTIDRGQFDRLEYVGYAPTCFMMLDAQVFQSVGRMDEQFFVYYDDTDFVWRMAARGIRIRYVPNSVVLHKVSTSTGGDRSPFTLYYTNRNRIYFIRKNLTGLQRVFALSYLLLTRLPRLCLLPRNLARRSWRGVIDGFGMKIPKELA